MKMAYSKTLLDERGKIKSISLTDTKPTCRASQSHSILLDQVPFTAHQTTYLRVFINDEETLEIDKLCMIFKLGGTDQLGDGRKALGMN